MKQLLILFLISLCSKSYSQIHADAILGKWLRTQKEDLIIEVFKSGNEYKGKIDWAKDSDKKRPVGFVILEKLVYNAGKKIWKSGKIHDPNSGRTYDAEAKIKSDGTLEVLGYIGFKFLGSKKYFKKVV